MSRYTIRGSDESFRRKHFWLPCIIDARFDDMSPEEQARAFRETYWSDNITNSEWPAVLRHDGVKPYVRSRLKKKIVGWLMAMGRIAALNPELYDQAAYEAQRLYHEQLDDCHPMFRHCPVCSATADSQQSRDGVP